MDNTLDTFKRQEPTTLSARAARAINCSRTLRSGVWVLVIGLACLGIGVLKPTKAYSQPGEECCVEIPISSPVPQYFGPPYQQKASTPTKAATQRPRQTIGQHRAKTTVPAFGPEASAVSKIALMTAMNSSIWITILHLMLSKTYFPERLLESIKFGAIIGMPIGTILGTIWGEAARRDEAKEKIGWRSLIWPATIFFGTTWASFWGNNWIKNKESTLAGIVALVFFGSLFVVGPFVMPHIIYAMRPPAKPAM